MEEDVVKEEDALAAACGNVALLLLLALPRLVLLVLLGLLLTMLLTDRCPSSGTVHDATCVLHLHGLTTRARL